MVIEPPKEDAKDKIISFAKNAVGTFAPGGASWVNIFDMLYTNPIAKRQAAWQQDVCDAINKLLKEGYVLEQLKDNEEFIEILHQATKVATITSKAEKRQSLKNAIHNAAHDDAPEFILQQIFLNYIEVFTVWHIRIITILNNPTNWFAEHNKSKPGMGGLTTVEQVLYSAVPDLKNNKDLVKSIWNELYAKGLITEDCQLLSHGTSPDGALVKRTSSIGDKFVKFITE